MRGSGRGRAVPSHAGDWPGRYWLSRQCRHAHLRVSRTLRGSSSARLRIGLGAGGLALAAAAAGDAAAAPGPGSGDGSEAKKKKSLSDFGHPRRRATDVFMALNAVCFVLNWLTRDVLLLWGCKVNALIAAGQVWRLVTPLFLHANLLHLAINTYALHTLGPTVEVVSGSKRTAVIYMASGVLATLASFMFNPAPSLGASGAVIGLGAALAVFYWRHREMLGPSSEVGLRSLGLTAAINIGYSMVNNKIDNWGHVGGFLAGALLAYLLGPHFVLTSDSGGRGLQDAPPLRWLAFRTPARKLPLSARGGPPAPGPVSPGALPAGPGDPRSR